jgi:hypothetical protein
MTKRLARSMRLIRWGRLTSIGLVLLAAGGAGRGGEVFGQTQATAASWRLASAQVVTSTERPPVLKLTANGPIAFQVLPADSSGQPITPGRIVARLYGVAPGDLASSGDLAPFALTVTPADSANGTDSDAIVTISTAAVSWTSGQALVMRAGMKSNEIEAAIVSAQQH